ncbi:MAG: hypothetical protein QY317_16420 [Candidatus Jettenia caeni]|nr:MAG: hypothetical protein QY317_16420 [Candidatus Jettenia caeni]
MNKQTFDIANIQNAPGKLDTNFSLLIIDLDYDEALKLIWDIRFQNSYKVEKGIPVVGLTCSGQEAYNRRSGIKFHLLDYGMFLNVPFTPDDLNDALKRAVYLDERMIEDVRVSVTDCGLIRYYLHEITPENYTQIIKELEGIVRVEVKDIIHGFLSANDNFSYEEIKCFLKELEDKVKSPKTRD